VPRNRPKRLKEAKRRLEEELWTEVRANRAYEAYRARGRMKDGRRFGRPPDPYQPPATPEGRINVTDPDSRVVKGLRGFLQGYNAQAVTNEHQVVLAAEIETVGADFGHLEPMLDATQRELARAGITELPEVLLADAGYWHGEQMQRILDRGIQVLIPPDTSRRKTTRRNWEGGRYDEMRRVLATDRGSELYRKRQPMIEPVFAQMKFNRGLDRFRRRGHGAVRAEWRLITATHNRPQAPPPRSRGRLTAAAGPALGAPREISPPCRPTSSAAGLSRQPSLNAPRCPMRPMRPGRPGRLQG
jgi:hypothetical protein